MLVSILTVWTCAAPEMLLLSCTAKLHVSKSSVTLFLMRNKEGLKVGERHESSSGFEGFFVVVVVSATRPWPRPV